MENLTKILDAISGEGRTEVEKILESGRKSSEDMMKLYEKEALIDEENILKRAEKRAAEIRQRSVSQAGIESRNIKLKARRQMLEKAFEKAQEKLAGLEMAEKKAFYEKIISKYSSGSEVTVQLNGEDMKALGKDLKADGIKINVEETAGKFSGGLVIKERSTETNCTFDVMVANAKKDMESEIAAMLFS